MSESRVTDLLSQDRGQSTIEVPATIMVFMLVVLLLVQPCILLHTRMVMGSAAAEGCRVLVTDVGGGKYHGDKIKGFIERRMQGIPPSDYYHVGDYDIELTPKSGGATKERVSVTITAKQKPLPLIKLAADVAGITDKDGNMTVKVTASAPARPSDVKGSPSEWVTHWD